jgi:hypothetical protein
MLCTLIEHVVLLCLFVGLPNSTTLPQGKRSSRELKCTLVMSLQQLLRGTMSVLLMKYSLSAHYLRSFGMNRNL